MSPPPTRPGPLTLQKAIGEVSGKRGCGLAAPTRVLISGVHGLCPTAHGRGPAPQQQGGGGEGGGSPWSGLLRWGKGEERGSSKERLTRFGGGGGYRDDVCMPAYLFFCLLAGGPRYPPGWVWGSWR